MNKETLRMQMLSGVITESEYKEKVEELRKGLYDNFDEWKKSFPEGTKFDNESGYVKAKDNDGKELGKWNPFNMIGKHVGDLSYGEVQEEKDSLNEHYIAGGIIGVGAINQIPSRAKADYEGAFEHFLSQKYDLNEVEKEVEEGKEVEEAMVNPNTNDRISYLVSALDHVWNMGKGNNSIDFEDLAQSIINDMFDDLEEGKEVEEKNNY